MTYLCLAAGKGTRFGRLGSYLQKCMYPIGTHPFLEYSLAALLDSETCLPGLDRLIVVIGHLGEQIVSYFGDSYSGLPLTYVSQGEQLGTGHAVECARRAVGFDEAIVWLADLFVPPRYFDAVRRHPEESLLTVASSVEEHNDDVRIDTSDGLVTRAFRGSSELFDIGLWKLGPELLDRIAEAKVGEYRVLVNLQRAIESGARVACHRAEEWVHLGGVSPTVEENLKNVTERMLREERLFDHH